MFWLLLGVSVLLLYFVLIRPLKYWSSRRIPQHTPLISWKQTVQAFIRAKTPPEELQDLYNGFPNRRYAGVYQFFVPMFMLRDPDLIKQITVKDFDHFTDHIQIVSPDTEPFLEKNLFSLKGEKWRDMRATLSPSFTSSKMKMVFGLIQECAEQFVRYFEREDQQVTTVEMKDAFTRFTNDVIASVTFGVSCDSLKDRENEFYMMGKAASNFGGFKLILVFLIPRIVKFFGISLFDKKAVAFFKELIRNNIETREREKIVRPDMINVLVEAKKGRLKHDEHSIEVSDGNFAVGKERKRQKEQLTDDDITAQAFVCFLAGFDTVSTAMSFMSYELALHPEIQQHLQSEIDDVLNDCDGKITYEALMKMKYLDNVTSETLRKWPPTFGMNRVCVKPYIIQPVKEGEEPVHLEEGDMLMWSIIGIQRDPQLYPNPERFDPERFSDENKAQINPYAYLAFGVGPRSCIGSRTALLKIKTVMFYILSKFDIIVVEKTTVPLRLGPNPASLSSKDGFWLGLKPRKIKS